jgi:hypothetical protein
MSNVKDALKQAILGEGSPRKSLHDTLELITYYPPGRVKAAVKQLCNPKTKADKEYSERVADSRLIRILKATLDIDHDLIIAAPDMLAALQKIVALHPADSILTEIKAARAAIEKATL